MSEVQYNRLNCYGHEQEICLRLWHMVSRRTSMVVLLPGGQLNGCQALNRCAILKFV